MSEDLRRRLYLAEQMLHELLREARNRNSKKRDLCGWRWPLEELLHKGEDHQ